MLFATHCNLKREMASRLCSYIILSLGTGLLQNRAPPNPLMQTCSCILIDVQSHLKWGAISLQKQQTFILKKINLSQLGKHVSLLSFDFEHHASTLCSLDFMMNSLKGERACTMESDIAEFMR